MGALKNQNSPPFLASLHSHAAGQAKTHRRQKPKLPRRVGEAQGVPGGPGESPPCPAPQGPAQGQRREPLCAPRSCVIAARASAGNPRGRGRAGPAPASWEVRGMEREPERDRGEAARLPATLPPRSRALVPRWQRAPSATPPGTRDPGAAGARSRLGPRPARLWLPRQRLGGAGPPQPAPCLSF